MHPNSQQRRPPGPAAPDGGPPADPPARPASRPRRRRKRQVRYVELYGRLLATANQRRAAGSPAPDGLPAAGRSASLHRLVLGALNGDQPPAAPGRPPAGSARYADAGVPLTPRAALLADLVQTAEVDYAGWTAAVSDAAAAAVTTPAEDADKRIGDGAALASVHHLVLTRGAGTTTPGVRAIRSSPSSRSCSPGQGGIDGSTDSPRLFGPDGEPASLFGLILPSWGMPAAGTADAARPGPSWAINLLVWGGWRTSQRAAAAITAAQRAEAAGRSWGRRAGPPPPPPRRRGPAPGRSGTGDRRDAGRDSAPGLVPALLA